MKALILAAGYATRLYPLTKDTPKPLLKLRGNTTVLDHIVSRLEGIDEIEEINIISNNKFFNHFVEWLVPKVIAQPDHKFKLINDGSNSDDNRLGAIRDIQLAIEKREIDDDLLVIAGDNLFDFDVRQFIAFARSRIPYHSICLYRPVDNLDLRKYGIAEVSDNFEIYAFEEKPREPRSDLIATCIYFFPAEKIRMVKEYLNHGCHEDNPGSYIRWLTMQDKVYGNTCEGMWFDLGDFYSLSNAITYLANEPLKTLEKSEKFSAV